MRFSIRVRPGASRTEVGGSHDGALVVKVTARAVEGQANAAVIRALSDALGVPRRAVSVVSGATSRTKIVQVEGGDGDTLEALLADLRGPRLTAGCRLTAPDRSSKD